MIGDHFLYRSVCVCKSGTCYYLLIEEFDLNYKMISVCLVVGVAAAFGVNNVSVFFFSFCFLLLFDQCWGN